MLKKQVIRKSPNLSSEYLKELLNSQKNLYSRYIYEYLECLINLDFSALKPGYLSESDMEILMQLDIFQSIVKYNIYEKALQTFKEYANDYNIAISPRDEKKNFLKVIGIDGDEQFIIFAYRAIEELINIELYNIIENPEARQLEINRLVNAIDTLYDNQAKKDYNTSEKSIQERIREYQTLRHELMNRSSLTSAKYQTLNHFNACLLKDYGFYPPVLPKDKITRVNNMKVSLTKSYPRINLTQNIQYY